MRKPNFLREQSAQAAWIYILVDLLMIYIGAVLSSAWVDSTLVARAASYHSPVVVAILLAISVFPSVRLYDSWRGRDLRDQMWRVSMAWALVVVGMVFVAFAFRDIQDYSRAWILSWAATSWFLLVLGRVTAYSVLLKLRARGWNHRRIFVIGSNTLVSDAVMQARANPSTGWEIVAAAITGQTGRSTVGSVPATGYGPRVESLARRLKVDEIWLCLPLDRQDLIDKALHDLRHSIATLRLLPSLQSLRLIRQPMTDVLGLPMLNLRVAPMQGISRIIKGVEDRVLAGLILLLISPILLVLAVGVKTSSPGPVFFRQKRMGWNGELFSILKFRSMPMDVEAKSGAVWAKAGENRSTAFGGFMRRTSLDELPQFINVLRGDMSIVGPRPERPVFVEQFKEEIPGYMQKHMVKAGITGWAQVNGWRGSTDLTKRIEHDLYYIEHWSLWFDLRIIFLTVFKGFVHKHAY